MALNKYKGFAAGNLLPAENVNSIDPDNLDAASEAYALLRLNADGALPVALISSETVTWRYDDTNHHLTIPAGTSRIIVALAFTQNGNVTKGEVTLMPGVKTTASFTGKMGPANYHYGITLTISGSSINFTQYGENGSLEQCVATAYYLRF